MNALPHPIALRQTFRAAAITFRLQRLGQMLGDRRDMAVRTPARDDHVVGHRAFVRKVNRDDVLGLVGIEGFHHESEQLLAGFRRALGRFRFRRFCGRQFRDCSFGCRGLALRRLFRGGFHPRGAGRALCGQSIAPSVTMCGVSGNPPKDTRLANSKGCIMWFGAQVLPLNGAESRSNPTPSAYHGLAKATTRKSSKFEALSPHSARSDCRRRRWI